MAISTAKLLRSGAITDYLEVAKPKGILPHLITAAAGVVLAAEGSPQLSRLAFTLLGGAGTSCVALAAEKYDSMVALVPYKWLYVLFVVVTVAIGVMMARSVVLLIKGRLNAYRYSVISLVLGVVVGGIHMAVSRGLRGSSMPVDAVTYTAVLTLIIFLLFRLPGVWEKVDYTKAKQSDSEKAGGATAIVSGLLALTIQYWMAPTHIMNGGVNYANAFNLSMTVVGWGLILLGIGLTARVIRTGLFDYAQRSVCCQGAELNRSLEAKS